MKPLPSHVLFLAALAAPGQAQTPEVQDVQTVLLVRGAPADVILNEPLLTAICGGEAMTKAITAAVRTRLESFSIEAALPAQHGAGVFQIHLRLRFLAEGSWNVETKKPVLAAAQKELQRVLDHLLFETPREELRSRCEELNAQLRELERGRAEMLFKARAFEDADAGLAARQLFELQQRQLEARIEIATERAALDQLAMIRAEMLHEIDALNTQRATHEAARSKTDDRIGQIEAEMKRIGAGGDPNQLAALGKLGRELRELQGANQSVAGAIKKLDKELRIPVLLLEQAVKHVSDSTLALKRSEARAEVLQPMVAELKKAVFAVQERARLRAELETSAERAADEAAPIRRLLQETQGRLARVQQVRYESFPAR